jgi:hypothetical protein
VTTAEAPLCTELEEAMTNVVATLKRMPAHWEDRRAGMHRKLNDLLDQWQAARG